jgi:uncharacterized protein (DUF4415 family)
MSNGLREASMKKEYDFKEGRRGAMLRAASGKTRITIRIDHDILDWFREQVHKAGGGSYQAMMNEALRTFVASRERDLEETLRRVLREELSPYSTSRARRSRRR